MSSVYKCRRRGHNVHLTPAYDTIIYTLELRPCYLPYPSLYRLWLSHPLRLFRKDRMGVLLPISLLNLLLMSQHGGKVDVSLVSTVLGKERSVSQS